MARRSSPSPPISARARRSSRRARKAELLGIKPENIFIDDLREEFVRDYVFPMFRANTVYEGQYLLGTSIARPLIAKRQIEIARQVGADAVCHGATGKGNDQVRFELGYYALEPDIRVIAPWREWEFASREQLIDFAEKHQIPISKDKRGEAPFSVDANLLHSSSEGKVLEDPAVEAPEYVHQRTISPEDAPDKPTIDRDRLRARRSRSRSTASALSPADPADQAQPARPRQRHRPARPGREPLRRHEVARRLRDARRHDPARRPSRHRERSRSTAARCTSRTSIMPRYAELIYNGFWFAPEREMLQALIDKSQEHVTGTVRMKLYKGNATVIGRESPLSLYDQDLVTFEEGSGGYDQRDAAGFIRLNALRLRIAAKRARRRHVKLAILETGKPPGRLSPRFGRLSGDVRAPARRRLRLRQLSTPRPARCRPTSGRSRRLSDHRLARPASMSDLPWIAPLSRPSSAPRRAGEAGRHLLRPSDHGRGAGRPCREIGQRLGRRACTPIRSSAASRGWTTRRPSRSPPRIRTRSCSSRRARDVIASSVFTPLCRPRLARPAGHLLPVPPGIRARLRRGADPRSATTASPIPTPPSPRSTRPTTMRGVGGWIRRFLLG